MFKHIPTPAINIITLVPPELIKGRGKPVGGIQPVTTAILRSVCTPIINAIPQARSEPNLSLAFSPILIIKITRLKNTPIRAISPKKPISSPIIDKIKSDSAKGRKRYFHQRSTYAPSGVISLFFPC